MKKENRIVGTGLLTAIAASLCCITPVLVLIAGTSGIAATFSWLEPCRPYLIGLTILIIGFAWYQKLKPKKVEECACDTAPKQRFSQTKTFLGIATVFAILMTAFPYYSKIFYRRNVKEVVIANQSAIHVVELKIRGLTCAACEEHVKHEVNKLAGIISSEVSYAKRNAIITFDSSITNTKAIEKAVNTTGYKVTESKIKYYGNSN